METKFKSMLAIIFLCSTFFVSNAYAYTYSIVFGGAGPGASTYSLATPISGSPDVTSKWNQPRNVSGTNPHRGVDLTASVGTNVIAPCNGFVISQDISVYELVFMCDRNGDTIKNDDLEVKFDHLSAVGFRTTNVYTTQGTKIAESGDEGGVYASGPHLHFGAMADRLGDKVWLRNEPYYRGSSTWDYGKRLDFISNVRWNTSNTAVVNSYAYDENGKVSLSSGDVVIFHRQNGTSTWTSATMTKSGDDYSFNLGSVYSNNTAVNWMVRATRPNLSVYDDAFMVPKWSQPDPNPNAVSNKYDYYSCTIGSSSCTQVYTTP